MKWEDLRSCPICSLKEKATKKIYALTADGFLVCIEILTCLKNYREIRFYFFLQQYFSVHPQKIAGKRTVLKPEVPGFLNLITSPGTL